MKSQRFNKTDPALIALISDLKAQERDNGAAIWRDIAKRLEKPKRNWAETNLSKLDRYANDGETIIIPDLPAGTKYVIEETDIPGGWKQTGEVGSEGNIPAAGEIRKRNDGCGTDVAVIISQKCNHIEMTFS